MTDEETKKNIEFWEKEVQKHLDNGDIMQAVGCRVLTNNLREQIRRGETIMTDEEKKAIENLKGIDVKFLLSI